MERIIKELKADYPLAKIPTHQFADNEAYFHLLLFAYNLVNWFKRLCLPEEYHSTTTGHATSSTPDDAGAVRADPARTNAKNTVLALGARSHHRMLLLGSTE